MGNLQRMIIFTPFECLGRLEIEMNKIFDKIATSGNNNITLLRELMDSYWCQEP